MNAFWKRVKQSQKSISFVIISICLVVTVFLILLRPKPVKKIPEPPSVLVEVLIAQPQDEQVSVTAYGAIQADRTVTMQPQVSGRVIEMSPNLVLGGLVKEGELLLTIDPRDFVLAIQQAEAGVTRAEFDLRVEEGRQIVAKREWELLDPTIKATEFGEELALRKPHLREKKAALASAQSLLDKAKLDHERTELIAPFDALVREENVEIGQLLSPQSSVATLVGTDAFRVQVSLPFQWLKWITIPGNEEEVGSLATIQREIGGQMALPREGRVIRLLGDLDPSGRMVRLLVRIEDPLGLKDPELRISPLLLDTYVRVELQGPILDEVFVLPRRAVREGDQVWVMNGDDRLEVRDINIVLGKEEVVIIDAGLQPGDRIVISPLPTAVPGMLLKEIVEPEEGDADDLSQ